MTHFSVKSSQMLVSPVYIYLQSVRLLTSNAERVAHNAQCPFGMTKPNEIKICQRQQQQQKNYNKRTEIAQLLLNCAFITAVMQILIFHQ